MAERTKSIKFKKLIVMPNVELKVGEVEAILDLLIAIEKKGQWLERLVKMESVHAQYFPSAVEKAIIMFSKALPFNVEPFDKPELKKVRK